MMEAPCTGDSGGCWLPKISEALNRELLSGLDMRLYEDRETPGKMCLQHACRRSGESPRWPQPHSKVYRWLSRRLPYHRCITSLNIQASMPNCFWITHMSWITTLVMNMDPITTWVESWPECLRSLEMRYVYYHTDDYADSPGHGPLPSTLRVLDIYLACIAKHVPPLGRASRLERLTLLRIGHPALDAVFNEMRTLRRNGQPTWLDSVENLTVIGAAFFVELMPFAAAPMVRDLKLESLQVTRPSDVVAVAGNVRSARLQRIDLNAELVRGHPHPFRVRSSGEGETGEEEADRLERDMVERVVKKVRSVAGNRTAIHVRVRSLANALPTMCALSGYGVWIRAPPTVRGCDQDTETAESVALAEMTTAFYCLPLESLLFRTKEMVATFKFSPQGVYVTVLVSIGLLPSLSVRRHMDVVVNHPTLRVIKVDVTRHMGVFCERCGDSFSPRSEDSPPSQPSEDVYPMYPHHLRVLIHLEPSYLCGWHEWLVRIVEANSAVLACVEVWCVQFARTHYARPHDPPPTDCVARVDPGFVKSLASALCRNNRLKEFIAPMNLVGDTESDLLRVFRENGTIRRFGTINVDAYEGDMAAFGTECMRSNHSIERMLMYSNVGGENHDLTPVLAMVERNAAYLNRAEDVVRAVRSAKNPDDKENVLNALAAARGLGCVHRVSRDKLVDRVGTVAVEDVNATYNYIVDRFLRLAGVCVACPPIKEDTSKCGLSDLNKDCISAISSYLLLHDVVDSP